MPSYTITVPNCQILGLAELYQEHLGYITNGRLVEVGAYNGYDYSNTYDLLKLGWGGLLIEPGTENYRALRVRYSNFPMVETVEVAVSDYTGNSPLYGKGALSSLLAANPGVVIDQRFEMVPVTTLDDILDWYGWYAGFELLVIDTEGTELQVLRGLDLGMWTPRMIIVETNKRDAYKNIARHLAPLYDEVHQDLINTIYMLRR